MTDWKLLVILAAIGLSMLYVRKYIGKKAENLAQKEDLRHLTDIVERVRAQFERANLVHRVQFEAEFSACQDVWRVAHDTYREFIRLFPMSAGGQEEAQRAKFANAQLAFSDTLHGCKPFLSDALWEAFYEFEGLMVEFKEADIPLVSRTVSREKASVRLDRCAAEIRKRFSELLVV